jgi:antitoxin component YwqK of YwqJK toxin-antitoxin module
MLIFLSFSIAFIYACKSNKREIIKTYPNGNPLVVFNFPDKNNKSQFGIEVFYPNGNIHRKLFVKNGYFVDSMITYFESKKVSQVDSLANPCDTLTRACNANRTIYYENGKIAERYVLKNGKYDGFSQHFDKNGILVKEYSLIKDSIKDGQYKEYDKNGKLDFKGFFKNDTLVGLCYYFDSNGDTIKYYNNYRGVMSLPYKKWLNDGRTLTGNFANEDKKSVLWVWYDKDNKKIKTMKGYPGKNGFIVPE